MAAAATAEPPAAAPAAPAPGTAAPAQPTPELHITPASIDRGPTPDTPRKGSAREAMFSKLREKAGETPTRPEAKPKPEPGPEPEPQPEPESAPEGGAAPAAATPEKKGKVSPWKLLDEHKAARLKAEQELAELRKSVPDPAKLKEEQERIAAIQKRAEELEQEIRFTNYAKSRDFQEKYQKPYEDAWTRWMRDLSEITVASSDSGEERPMSPQDLLELVNLPLPKARARAEEQFGNFADDVMSARKEIRSLYDAQQRALEEARKLGAERDAQRTQEMQAHQENLAKEVRAIWKEANESVLTDEKLSKFFQPVEGDTEGNERLQKGFELADKAFAVSPFAPNLTPEQRADVVRLHAAIRNRAAAFGRLTHMNRQLEAKVKELTDTLEKFKGVQPGAGSGVREADRPGTPASARDQVFAALRKRAH